MKRSVFYLFCLFTLLAIGCTRQTFDDPNGTDGIPDNPLIANINTPTFDYQMGGAIELTISDVSHNATYTIYSFNNDHKVKEDVEIVNDNGELETFKNVELPKEGCWDEITSIVSQGAGAKLRFDVPNDIEQLIIRKHDQYGYSFQNVDLAVSRPLERTVTFEDHLKGKEWLKSAQGPDNFSVLWGLNAEELLFSVDLAIPMDERDLGEIKQNTVDDPNNGATAFHMQQLEISGAYEVKDAQPFDPGNELLEEGSWTIAMDDSNTSFYTIGKDKINIGGLEGYYPVFQYHLTGMQEGNGRVDSYEIVGKLPFTAPRLEVIEGFLYVSTNRKIIQMIPRGDGTLLILDTVPILNLTNNQGGDIVNTDPATSEDQALWYIATFGGLYEIGWDPNQGVEAYRRSADNLPFAPTSLAYSKFQPSPDAGSLWVADYYQNSALYIMDPVYGSFERRYHFNHKINDLTCANAHTDYVFEDVDPADPDVFYSVSFPSKYGWGSIAFEDLYPLMSDYDFNDVVIDFKYDVYYSGPIDPQVQRMELFLKLRNITGASYRNGFGFCIDGVPSAYVESVEYENQKLSTGTIQMKSNGTEDGLTNSEDAAFIVFDDAYNYQLTDKEMKVTIHFTDFALNADFYNGFDPFIFVDGNRMLEIHQPNKNPTSKNNFTEFLRFHGINGAENLDNHNADDLFPNINNDYRGYQAIDGKYYNGFPWVLVTPHQFLYPKEEVPISLAYLKYKFWANLSQLVDDVDHETGSEERYEDWYSDKEGYRHKAYIDYNTGN